MLWALKQKRGSQATTVDVFAYNCPKIMKPLPLKINMYMIKYNNRTYLQVTIDKILALFYNFEAFKSDFTCLEGKKAS